MGGAILHGCDSPLANRVSLSFWRYMLLCWWCRIMSIIHVVLLRMSYHVDLGDLSSCLLLNCLLLFSILTKVKLLKLKLTRLSLYSYRLCSDDMFEEWNACLAIATRYCVNHYITLFCPWYFTRMVAIALRYFRLMKTMHLLCSTTSNTYKRPAHNQLYLCVDVLELLGLRNILSRYFLCPILSGSRRL